MFPRSVLVCLLLCCVVLLVQSANVRSHSNAIVRVSNMTEAMQQDAIRISKQAFDKFHGYSKANRSSMAQYIRFQFDQLHGPTWQCILGMDYALSIISENGKRIILDIGKVSVLIFKGKC